MNYLGIEVPEIVWILDFIERIQSFLLAFFFILCFSFYVTQHTIDFVL
jgi:hypothetical protein